MGEGGSKVICRRRFLVVGVRRGFDHGMIGIDVVRGDHLDSQFSDSVEGVHYGVFG